MTHPPPDKFCLGDTWRSPRGKDWHVDKVEGAKARLRIDGGPSTWFHRCTRCGKPCDAELVPSTAVQVAAVCTFNPTPSTQ